MVDEERSGRKLAEGWMGMDFVGCQKKKKETELPPICESFY